MLNNINPQPIPKDKWEKGIKIYTDVSSGRLTIEQAENEIAKMDSDILMEFKYLEPPDINPDYEHYTNCSYKEREKLSHILKDYQVIAYLEKKAYIDSHNVSCKHHLQEYLKAYERLNMANEAIICKNLLLEYEGEQPEPIKTVKMDYLEKLEENDDIPF